MNLVNLAINIGLNIITLAGIVWCFSKLIFLSAFFGSKKAIAGACAAWILIFNIPCMEWSLKDYAYALFDTPSMMFILLCLYYLLRFWVGGFVEQTLEDSKQDATQNLQAFLHKPFFPSSMQYVWIVFGSFLYFGILGYGFVDIYHLEFRITLFILCVISIISYGLSTLTGWAIILCIIAYKMQILGQMSIWEYCIDPFLWVGCIVVTLWRGFCFGYRICVGVRDGKKVA